MKTYYISKSIKLLPPSHLSSIYGFKS